MVAAIFTGCWFLHDDRLPRRLIQSIAKFVTLGPALEAFGTVAALRNRPRNPGRAP